MKHRDAKKEVVKEKEAEELEKDDKDVIEVPLETQ